MTSPPNSRTAADLKDKSLKPKIPWRSFLLQPGMLILAIGLASAHHFYYSFLDDQIVGSPSRQQWSIRIGTGLAWSVVALLKAVAGFAYVQLLFWLLRRNSIAMQDIDALFDLRKADPSAFLTQDLWRKAILLVPFACIIITLPVAAVLSPATLSAISATGPQQMLPSMNWTLASAYCRDYASVCGINLESIIVDILSMGKVLEFFKPASNTSYRLTFEGPSLSCVAPNATQQLAFNSYANTSAVQDWVYVDSTLKKWNHTDAALRYYSAFVLDILHTTVEYQPELGDLYKYNWGHGKNEIKSANTLQFWIQLFDENIVCTFLAAEFDIGIAFDTGYQVITYNNFTQKEAIPVTGGYGRAINRLPFDMLTDFLSGNTTLLISNNTLDIIRDLTETVRQSNLMPCLLPSLHHILEIFPNVTVPGSTSAELRSPNPNTALQGCPASTLANGIVEMMNNLTISMISTNNPEIKNLTIIATSGNRIIYIYNTRELLATYGIAILVVAAVFIVGLFAISHNGVVHDSSFSAIVAMTRNPKLDTMFANENMSGYPLTDSLRKQRLRFGASRSTCKCNRTGLSHDKGCSLVAAFGTEDEIEPLQLRHKRS